MDRENASLADLREIRQIMERSSRFISLSGWSGVGAGVVGLAGALFASDWLRQYRQGNLDGAQLKTQLVLLALVILVLALTVAFYFTWRRASREGVARWEPGTRNLIFHLSVPLLAGAGFAAALLARGVYELVAPATLVFYGLALLSAGKYTVREIRGLGLLESTLGLVALIWPVGGLYFWALGFGVMHLIYGLLMWWKYERGNGTTRTRHA